jgi:hypothetical protein
MEEPLFTSLANCRWATISRYFLPNLFFNLATPSIPKKAVTVIVRPTTMMLQNIFASICDSPFPSLVEMRPHLYLAPIYRRRNQKGVKIDHQKINAWSRNRVKVMIGAKTRKTDTGEARHGEKSAVNFEEGE